MKTKTIVTALSLALGALTTQAADRLDRTVLPITEPLRKPTTTLDVRKATPPPRFEAKAPEGAPNVLLAWISTDNHSSKSGG
jgi:hypothetical protein